MRVAKLDNLPKAITKFALDIISEYDAPIYLAVDDTLIEKVGKKFEKVKILFDHSKKKVLPYAHKSFAFAKDLSPQEFRFELTSNFWLSA